MGRQKVRARPPKKHLEISTSLPIFTSCTRRHKYDDVISLVPTLSVGMQTDLSCSISTGNEHRGCMGDLSTTSASDAPAYVPTQSMGTRVRQRMGTRMEMHGND